MTQPYRLFGRLGNQLFQYAFLLDWAKKNGSDWYFQSEKWFKDNEKEVRALFSDDIPAPTDRVAIHVRRGDYVGNSFYVDLFNIDYYEKAMAMFPDDKFILFSDDIAFCKAKFGWYNSRITYSEERSDVRDLNLMASCKAHIIANSSFSWWGAWLSPNYPNNKVIAPSKEHWYADGVERTECPSHWIRI